MIKFEYLEPKTLQEATSLLATHGEKAAVLSGGTDLLIALKLRTQRPQYVVNIKRIPNLDYLTYHDAEGLKIGALCLCRDVFRAAIVREKYPMLAETAGILGSRQIQNTATVMGNICNALPSAELAPPLLVLDARVRIAGPNGRARVVSLEQFFTGPRTTVLQPGELAVEVQVPPPPPHNGAMYIRLSPRRAMDLAVVGVASFVTLDASGETLTDARIGLGAVAPTPLRARQAEAVLKGQRISDDLLNRAGEVAMGEAKPITDIRGSAEYRREMVRVLTRRLTKEAIKRARQWPNPIPIRLYPTAMDVGRD